MKKIISLSIIVCTLFGFMGCGAKTVNSNVEVSDIVKSIKEVIVEDLREVGMPEESFKEEEVPGYMELDLTKEEDSLIFDMFNREDIESGAVIQAMMNINSDMIIILKAKDDSKVEALKKSLKKIKENQVNTWSQYLPSQYEKVEKNILKVEGQYLIYITYENPEKIEEIFVDSLK